MEPIFEMTQGRDCKDELFVGESIQQIREQLGGGLGVEEKSIEAIGRKFMAIGHHVAGGFVAKHPGRAKADDDPLGIDKTRMLHGEMSINLINKALFGRTPEISVVAEGAVEALAHLDDFIMAEGLTALQTDEGGEHTKGVVKCSEGIHLGVKAKSLTKIAYFIGETGAQKEQAIAVDNGLGERGDINWGCEVQWFFVITLYRHIVITTSL